MVYLATPSPLEGEIRNPSVMLRELNEKRYQGFYGYNVQSQLTPDGYTLLNNVKPHRFILVTDDDKQDIVCAVTLYNLSCSINDHNPCVQPCFWRFDGVGHDDAISWFGQYVIDEILKKYTLVIPDNEDFAKGHRFWESRLALALTEMGIAVYAPEGGEHDKRIFCRRLRSLYDFFPLWVEFYHDAVKASYSGRLFIISRHQATERR